MNMPCPVQMLGPTIASNCHNDKELILEKSLFTKLMKVVKKISLIRKLTSIKINQNWVALNLNSSFPNWNFIKTQSENVASQWKVSQLQIISKKNKQDLIWHKHWKEAAKQLPSHRNVIIILKTIYSRPLPKKVSREDQLLGI